MSQGLADAVKSMKPEDLEPQREMVRDLNELLARADAGRRAVAGRGRRVPRSSTARSSRARETLDDVIDQLADRMAAMQSLHALALARSSAPSSRTRSTRCCATTGSSGTSPSSPRTSTSCCPAGWGSGSGSAATSRWASRRRSSSSAGSRRSTSSRRSSTAPAGPATSARSTAATSRDLLGADAARDLDALEDLADRLERAGYLERDGDRLELTPRGNRRIGQKVLDELFARLRPRRVRRPSARAAGHGGERDETSKPFEFGDPFHLDLPGTLGNALRARRTRRAGGQPGRPSSSAPDDFEVYRTEHRPPRPRCCSST